MAKLPPKEEREQLARRLKHTLPWRPTPDEVDQVARAFMTWAPADDDGIADLIVLCRQVRADATIDEIAAMVNEKGPSIRTAKRPIGLAKIAVPRCFAGGSFEARRLSLQRQAEQVERDRAAGAERDRMFAEEILRSPDADEDQRQWAMKTLNGETKGAGG